MCVWHTSTTQSPASESSSVDDGVLVGARQIRAFLAGARDEFKTVLKSAGWVGQLFFLKMPNKLSSTLSTFGVFFEFAHRLGTMLLWLIKAGDFFVWKNACDQPPPH